MNTELIALATAVCGLLGKVGWDHFKARKNGIITMDEIKLDHIAQRELGVRDIQASIQANANITHRKFDELIEINKEANRFLNELVYTSRARRSTDNV